MNFSQVIYSSPAAIVPFEFNFYFLFLCPIFGSIGFLLCSISIFIFSQEEFKEKLYSYLRMECLFMGLNLLTQAFRPIVFCDFYCTISKSLPACALFIYGLVYLVGIYEMCTLFFSFNSALHVYCLINSNNRLLSRILDIQPSYKTATLLILAFGLGLYSFVLFQYEIVYVDARSLLSSFNVSASESNETQNRIYRVKMTEFYFSNVRAYIEIAAMIVRDGVGITLNISINILLFASFRRNIQTKSKLLNIHIRSDLKANRAHHPQQLQLDHRHLNHHHQHRQHHHHNHHHHHHQHQQRELESAETSNRLTTKMTNSDNSAEARQINEDKLKAVKRFERRAAKMIILNCSNCILGRLPIFTTYLLRNFISNETIKEHYIAVSCILVYVSYIFSFFLYYSNNKRFKEIFLRIFCFKRISS
jgi:hypothetical protein